jgi:hypothetical protein
MTAGSTCGPRSADRRGRRPALPGSTAAEARARQRAGARQEAAGRLCAVRADLPGLRQRHRRCVRPRIPGFSPGGLGPHLTSSGSPRGLSSGFPFARRVLPRRPPSCGFPSSGVLRFVPFGRRPGSGSPFRCSSGFPFPWAILTIALPPGGSAGFGPGRQGPRSPALPPPSRSWISPSSAQHHRRAAAGHNGCRYRIACYERPRAQDTAAPEPPRSADLAPPPQDCRSRSAVGRSGRAQTHRTAADGPERRCLGLHGLPLAPDTTYLIGSEECDRRRSAQAW